MATTSVPAHSGSRWEPLPQPGGDDDVRARTPAAAVSPSPRAAHKTPRVVIATIVSALALGGAGTTLAVVGSAEPDSAAIPVTGTARHPDGRTSSDAGDTGQEHTDRGQGR